MKKYYFVSPYKQIPPPKPFDWKAFDDKTAEIRAIIQVVLDRNFREIQSGEIKRLITMRYCPKCRGKLLPCEDGMKCFTCGLIVYDRVKDDYF